MNKLEVGMYVRTNTGIHKIFKIDEKKTVWKYLCDKKSTGEWDGSYEYTPIKEEQIIGKPSFDIIDLVQEDDYVNGDVVTKIKEDKQNNKYIVTIFNDVYYNKDIESIVTKEQFESMEYRIGE